MRYLTLSLCATISLGFTDFFLPKKAFSASLRPNETLAVNTQTQPLPPASPTLNIGGNGPENVKIDSQSITVGNPSQPADSQNGYVKVGAGSSLDISNNGSLTIQAKPTIAPDGTRSDYPTLQIGTTAGNSAASVNMDHGTLNVNQGQIQVGDLVGQPSNSQGGPATLTATDSTINGGMQIGLGGNSASSVSLTNSTYNDQGLGLLVGSQGKNNSFTQNGGTSNIGLLDVGGVDDNGAGDSTAAGTMNFNNGAVLNVNVGDTGGVTIGDHGTGSVTFDHSSLNSNGIIVLGNYEGSQGTLTFQNGSTGKTNAIFDGAPDGGTGTVKIDNSSVIVGDASQPANDNNGYVKVGAGSNLDIVNGGSLTIQAKPTIAPDGTRSDYATLQIGTTTGNDAASVNMDHGTLNVDGQIQVGDLVGQPSNSQGGPATLTATDSTINGGMQIGLGGNSASSVTLINSTYNDKGLGLLVGQQGTDNHFTQYGGTSTVGLLDVGGVDNNGQGDSKAVGTMNFNNGAVLNVNGGDTGGVIIGDHGTGNVTFDHSSLNSDGMIVLGNYEGSQGTLTLQNGSAGKAKSIFDGAPDGGTGLITVDHSSLTVGDASQAATENNGYLHIGQKSDVDVINNGTLTLASQNEYRFPVDSSNNPIPVKPYVPNGSYGTLHVDNGGTVAGVGIIDGNVNIGQGGTIRPGLTNGTLTVNGNTNMGDGSKMVADLGTQPDLTNLHDKGSFTIQSGSTLETHIAEGAQLKVNQAYDVVHADGGVSGTFSAYKQDGKIGSDAADGYAVMQSDFGHVAYGPDDVKVTLAFNRDRGLGWGGDRNQTGVGGALSPLVGGTGALSGIANILAGSDNAQRLYNLTQMDGEIASDMRTGNINNNFWIRDSVNNRLDCLEDTFRQIANGKTTNSNVCGVTGKKVNVWGTMYGSQGGQNGHSGWNYATRASDNNAGFIWGVDGEIGSDGYAEDRWHVGMMMGYGSVMESSGGVSSRGESNNANIGMYFGKQVRFDNQNFFTFHGQFGYTWNIMSWHRSVNLQGAAAEYNQTLHAHELGGTAHVNAEIAYKHVFNLWGTPLEIAPTGSITYLNYEQGSYHETGGNLALHGRATNTNLGYGFMGAKIATNFNIGDWVITPHGKFGYRRSFGANQSYTHAGFEALGGGTDMSIVGVPVVQDQALTEVGFDVHPTEYLSFGANYVGLYGGHSQTMSGGQLSAKIAF